MVGCSENIINLPDQQLLVHLCTVVLLLLHFHTFSKLMYFYKRAIMVGCSENIINFPD